MKKFKIVLIILLAILVTGAISFLLVSNIKANKAYEESLEQINALESQLTAIGYFTDVFTVKTSADMGQEITEKNISQLSMPTAAVPENVILDKSKIIGKYWRIEVSPGTAITSDLVVDEGYTGTIYQRELHMDASLPIGLTVGDYIDVRVVLPGGEEFVVFPHKRVNAKYEDTLSMKFDEADLWMYTSMMIDRSLYKAVGLKLYATKYVDPGAHDKTVAYYPIRREAVDIMSIAPNLSATQKNRLWNESLRNAIDKKLSYYTSPGNLDAPLIAAGVSEEESRAGTAKNYFETLLQQIKDNPDNALVDPDAPVTDDTSSETPVTDNTSSETPTTDGPKDNSGNSSVITKDEKITNLGDDLMKDETVIK